MVLTPMELAIKKLASHGIAATPDKIHTGYLKIITANYKTILHYTEIYTAINNLEASC